MNYFNPAFSWYESLFGPQDLGTTLAAFPIVLQGVGSNAPFTPLGGLDYNWVQGRRATRFQLNDSLSWTAGRHQVKAGVSARRLRLNDYDFCTYDTPLVTYSTLAQFIYGVASTATKAFPVAASQPFNYLNLDVFAQDTMKLTAIAHLDFRRARRLQLEPFEPAQPDRPPSRLVRFRAARSESAAEPDPANRPDRIFRLHAAGALAAADRAGLAGRRRKPCCEPASACSATCCPAASWT